MSVWGSLAFSPLLSEAEALCRPVLQRPKFKGLAARPQTSFPDTPTLRAQRPCLAFPARTLWALGPKAKFALPAEGSLGKGGALLGSLMPIGFCGRCSPPSTEQVTCSVNHPGP